MLPPDGQYREHNTAASHKMLDREQPDSSRHYENTKHFEFVNVVFQGGQTFVSGEYVFPSMLDTILYWVA